MEWILATLFAAGLASAGVLAVQHRRTRKRQAEDWRSKIEERDLDNLRSGDVLLLEGKDLIISGVAHFSEGRARWQECFFDERHKEHWMAVRRDDPEHVVLGLRLRELPIGRTPPGALEHEGKIYRLKRRGTAQVEIKGTGWEEILGEKILGEKTLGEKTLGEKTLGEKPLGEKELSPGKWMFWRYDRPGADRLWIYRWGEQYLLLAGQRVKRHLITLLPGPD